MPPIRRGAMGLRCSLKEWVRLANLHPDDCGVMPSPGRDPRNPLALSLLPLSQPDPGAATVLVDELYAGGFQSGPYLGPCNIPTAQWTILRFEPLYRRDRDIGCSCQPLLRPCQ